MRSRRGTLVAVAWLFAVVGCGHADFDPPDRAARIRDAEERFTGVRFDTLTWESDAARARTGNEVFARKCRNCHGPLGRGDTDYSRTRGLTVPSLVDSGWPLASIDSVRHRVYVGHVGGMPTWGVAGITPAEVDAVSFYVIERLRPDVLQRAR